MKVAGIILAAGSSSRMGRPKALLEYRGETFLTRLSRLLQPLCSPLIIVGAPDSPYAADIINRQPELGMLSSLQCGLRAIADPVDAVLFTLVDSPAISEATLQSLVSGGAPATLRIPRYAGKRGHPVLFNPTLIPEFLAAAGTPKQVIERHHETIHYLDLDDPGITHDADTPAEYQELIANG